MASITSIGTDDTKMERLGCCTAGLTQFRMQVAVDELELGMRVDELDKPWLDSSFLFQGFFIETEEDLAALRQECKHVYVTVTRQVSTKERAGSKQKSGARLFNWSSTENKQYNR